MVPERTIFAKYAQMSTELTQCRHSLQQDCEVPAQQNNIIILSSLLLVPSSTAVESGRHDPQSPPRRPTAMSAPAPGRCPLKVVLRYNSYERRTVTPRKSRASRVQNDSAGDTIPPMTAQQLTLDGRFLPIR